MMMRRFAGIGTAVAAILTLACGSDKSTGPEIPVPATLAVVGSTPETATAGATLAEPIRVIILDAKDEPMSGVQVSWKVLTGGGSLSAASSTTDESGEASATWTLGGEVGENGASATVTGLDPVVFMVRGVPGEPAAVTLLSEGAAVDTLSLPDIGESRKLTGRVLDEHGNEISSPALEWSTSDTAVASVDSAGRVTAKGAGEAEITASSGAAKGSLTVRVTRAPATLAISVASASLGEGDTLRLSVVVKDRNGAVIPAAAVTWTSADAWVATVDAAGLVEAVHEGEVKITAASGKASASAAISVMGKIAFVKNTNGHDQIFIANSDGSGVKQITVAAQDHRQPTWAPDGSRFAYVIRMDGKDYIHALSLDRQTFQVLSDGDGLFDTDPAWSPDGTRIAFVSYRNGISVFRIMNADGSNQRTIGSAKDQWGPISWSPDGKEIVFSAYSDDRYLHLFTIKADGSEVRKPVDLGDLEQDWDYIYPSISPDGSKLLFSRVHRTGKSQIWVISLRDGESKLLSAGIDDDAPTWSPDGTKILFRRWVSSKSKLYIMNADGTEARGLMTDIEDVGNLMWRPRPKR